MRQTVADAASEALFREASEAGAVCAYWIRQRGGDRNADAFAVRWAQTAAGLYHEAQRLSAGVGSC